MLPAWPELVAVLTILPLLVTLVASKVIVPAGLAPLVEVLISLTPSIRVNALDLTVILAALALGLPPPVLSDLRVDPAKFKSPFTTRLISPLSPLLSEVVLMCVPVNVKLGNGALFVPKVIWPAAPLPVVLLMMEVPVSSIYSVAVIAILPARP